MLKRRLELIVSCLKEIKVFKTGTCSALSVPSNLSSLDFASLHITVILRKFGKYAFQAAVDGEAL